MTIARHWTPSSQDLMQLRDVALGLLPADLVVKNSRLFCMHTGEIRDVNIALKRGFIAAVAPAEHHFSAEKVVDGQNKYLLPTLDADLPFALSGVGVHTIALAQL